MGAPKGAVNNPTGKGGPKKGDPSRNPSGSTSEEQQQRKKARALLFAKAESLVKDAISFAESHPEKPNPMLQFLVSQVLGKEPDKVEASITSHAADAEADATDTGTAVAIIRREAKRSEGASGVAVAEGRTLAPFGPEADGAA